MSVLWHVAFFGGLEVSCGDTPLRFATRKTAALFAFLAFHPGKSFSRDYLVTQFWPDDDVERGRNSLRVALSGLKKQLESLRGGDLLQTDRVHLSLASDNLDTDVIQFRASLRREQEAGTPEERKKHLRTAIALYHGPLLADWYEDWITPERERLTEAYGGALRRLATLLMDGGTVEEALEMARRAVEAEPIREESHRCLIDLYRRAGQSDAALRQYRELERTLRDELGVAPSRETQGLMARMRTEQEASTRAATRQQESLPPTPLTLPATSFIGRTGELAHLASLCFREGDNSGGGIRSGVVTVAGLPGVGKSRLVIETLRHAGLTTPGSRLWRLSLEGASTAGDVGVALSRLLSIPVTNPDEVGATLAQRIGTGAGVVFLDEVDTGPETVAPFIQAMVRHLPNLLVIVAAPQPLGLSERVLILSPLPVPETRGNGTAEEFESVQLFEERARAVNPGFRVGSQGEETIAELCKRLDGIPLALEAAASWAGFMTPDEMVRRLTRNPFEFLVNQTADCPARHRSPGTRFLDYCHALPEAACDFLLRLGVFHGGWTLTDAEYVSGEPRSLDFLTTLQRRAVVSTRGEGETVRFFLGELTRAFALSTLPLEARRTYERRHAERFAGFAEAFGARVNSREGANATCRLRGEQANLIAALDNCLGDLNEPTLALRITAALWRFWYMEQRVEFGNGYLERAIIAAGTEVTWTVRSHALEGLGRFALNLGHLTRAVGVLQDALDTARSHGDTSAERLTTLATNLLVAACARGDLSRTREVSKLLLALKMRERDIWAAAMVRTELSRASEEFGDSGGAHAAEARRLLITLGFDAPDTDTQEGNLGYSFLRIGHLAVEQGDYAASVPVLQDAVRAFRNEGSSGGAAVSLERLGIAQARMGYTDAARDVLEEALALRLSGVGKAGEPFTRRLLAGVVRDANDTFTLHTLLTENQESGRDDLPDGDALESGK